MKEYPYFPLFTDISKKKTVVIGGGAVASRRVGVLSQFTGDITVIAPDVREDILKTENVRVIKKRYEKQDIAGADIVLAAADDSDVNDAVWRDCKQLRILVNVASDRSKSDFYFPGIAKKGFLVAGVTASGKDHSLAKKAAEMIRSCIEKL